MEKREQCQPIVKQTYTAEEVARILGISIRQAYVLCEATKDFRVMHLGKRCLRIHKESFDHWFSQGNPE